jgi:hypothetical protein
MKQEVNYWFEEQFWCKAQSLRPLRSALPCDQRSTDRWDKPGLAAGQFKTGEAD